MVYIIKEKFGDTKRAIRRCKSKKGRQHNGQKVTQRSIKHYTENQRSSNTNPTKNCKWNPVLRKGKQFLLHMWHQSGYSCCKL